MLRFLKGFFGKPIPPESKVPYKTEMPAEPAPAKCGCGRSQSGLCVGLHKLTAEEWATHESNPNAVKPAPAEVGKPADDRVEATAPVKPAPKPRAKPAAKPIVKPAAKPAAKPAVMKAPAKPKAPRKPSATK
jgi:hypothetical protein